MVTLHLIAPPPPPPDHVLIASIRPTVTPRPVTPPPPPMALPSLPRVAEPAIVPLLETPALPNAITVPPAPPVVRTPPAPFMPPTPPGPPPRDFLTKLYARINAFKRYPPSALSARIQGRPVVHFVMSRQGRVLELALAQSSGVPQLDQAALVAVRDAQPLPDLPPEIPGESYAVTVGINFSVNR